MWNATLLDGCTGCLVCKGDEGPFWVGPQVPTERLGPRGIIKARIHICARCVFIAADGEGSPYEGELRYAQAAEEAITALQADLAAVRQERDVLRPKAALLDTVLAHAAGLAGAPA